jgi:hypothetical protein
MAKRRSMKKRVGRKPHRKTYKSRNRVSRKASLRKGKTRKGKTRNGKRKTYRNKRTKKIMRGG